MSLKPTFDETSAPLLSMRPRHEQTYPLLSAAEIERMRKFGDVRRFQNGEQMLKTGAPHPGLFVVLSGNVVITQRDGLGRVTPTAEYSAGRRSASCRDALRWSTAMPKVTSRPF